MQGHDCGASAEFDEAHATTDAMLGVDLLELVDESIFLRDLNGRIRYWNKASEELYGWSSAEALGQSAHDLLRCQHAEALTSLNQK